MAGVPPDYFSDTGQLWGNPIFNWRRLKADGYRWWIERIRANLRLVDWIRLDHFRGFVAYWRVPRGATTAQDGRWIRGPGRELFDALVAALGTLPFVAEDLGVITPAVRRLRRELGLPGMKVLQFGFDEARSTHHPDRVAPDEVVYTGTHDNDTTRGWLATLDAAARARVDRVLARQGDRDAVWALVAAAQRSPATLAVVPMQDVLGLGSEARMNTPAVADGNWAWRLTEAGLEGDTAARLRALVEESGRR
jgi:4-alpha-glucanotransferase